MSRKEKREKTSAELAPALGARETLRWTWRQLTSMRTALFLLMLLAITAVPGSIVPQRGVDARRVETYLLDHPDLGPWLDRLGFFSVYTSPWFSAVYLLLMISLVGCIIPRCLVYARALKARPPRAPRNFSRLPASAVFEVDAEPEAVLEAGRKALGRSRTDVDTDLLEVRSEKGYLRELGNLIFHVSIVVVLVSVAIGALYSYRGAAVVVQGDSFANTLTQYDEFSSGALFDTDKLPYFSLDLKKMQAQFLETGAQRGSPKLFRATVDYQTSQDGASKPYRIEVNHPLIVDGTGVFLVGQGYAPVLKVTDAQGKVVFDDAVPFLPSDPSYTSSGVLKVPDAQPDQLGFQGFFLPTALVQGDKVPSTSIFPAAQFPLLGLFAYRGDLGLDEGIPQSVYVLDKKNLKQFTKNGKALRISLQPGQRAKLPDGSTIEFRDLLLFARFQVADTPLVKVPLVGTSLGVLGLLLSLFIQPRRTWIRARREGSRTVVEVAALDRAPRDDLPDDLDHLVERIRHQLGEPKETT
ncbi:hypothetical protein ASD11_13150 [Aeromicrobium sp. Root495]|uniref:cytochrome c biogenesis protein ResB n=1 Tax=Aeromicrobium sp. Root495 TaxID=1736550 RepID=UPI0006FFF324|nr:cytochrome c biogenesis protein ResB [Aeromicrobium sp. Root495]KQY60391.1 hypothetical protein ASD11_13150 [Aeromicrobium sp. Root495]